MTDVLAVPPFGTGGLASTMGVVVVNWNTAHLIDDCIRSVRDAAPQAEIVVVDNGSADASLDVLAELDVHVIENDDNVGYQAACNQGTRATDAPIVLHINTDARLQPGALAGLLDVLDQHPEVGVVAPRLEYGDGSFQRWTAGTLPSLRSLSVSFLLLDRFGTAGRGVWIDSDREHSGPVGWVSSACLVLRREVFDAIGGLDERLFAYMDDVDLCRAAADAGWTVWYESSVSATHFMGGSQAHPGNAASPRAIRSMGEWFRLHHGPLSAHLAAVIMTAGFLIRAGAHLAGAAVRRSSIGAARQHLRHARAAFTAGRRT